MKAIEKERMQRVLWVCLASKRCEALQGGANRKMDPQNPPLAVATQDLGESEEDLCLASSDGRAIANWPGGDVQRVERH